MGETVLILDFGGQYTKLIAKNVRKLGVFSKILPHHTPAYKILNEQPSAIILSGGPKSTRIKNAPTIDPKILESEIPLLGICYGHQLIQKLMGGEVGQVSSGEYGKVKIYLEKDPVFSSLASSIDSWMSHQDSVTVLSPYFKVIAKSKDHIAAVRHNQKKIYGFQFHPEVTHMKEGAKILSAFLKKVANLKCTYSDEDVITQGLKEIEKARGKTVISFVSGGIDSSFVSALLAKSSAPKKVVCVYVDALMRKNETEEIQKALKGAGVHLKVIRAQDRFIEALQGEIDPEKKRKIIGNLFGTIQEEVLEELKLEPKNTLLAQGTLYTDLIESGKGKADTIKSHHNVGCTFIEKLKKEKRIIEPNQMIFKDEVRAAGRLIGLPESICKREPFPGPGLGIRIIAARKKDPDFDRRQKKLSEIGKLHEFEVALLPIKTVGVGGDQRTYEHLTYIEGPFTNYEKIKAKLLASDPKINRIVYAPLGTKKENKALSTTITKENVRLLQDIDDEGRKIVKRYALPDLAQSIFVLCGVSLSEKLPSLGVRLVASTDFMTASHIDFKVEMIEELQKQILTKYPVGAVFFDVTEKPPATVEWE